MDLPGGLCSSSAWKSGPKTSWFLCLQYLTKYPRSTLRHYLFLSREAINRTHCLLEMCSGENFLFVKLSVFHVICFFALMYFSLFDFTLLDMSFPFFFSSFANVFSEDPPTSLHIANRWEHPYQSWLQVCGTSHW